eukprot:2715923-Pleurochrysis_carterae.AAC.1
MLKIQKQIAKKRRCPSPCSAFTRRSGPNTAARRCTCSLKGSSSLVRTCRASCAAQRRWMRTAQPAELATMKDTLKCDKRHRTSKD